MNTPDLIAAKQQDKPKPKPKPVKRLSVISPSIEMAHKVWVFVQLKTVILSYSRVQLAGLFECCNSKGFDISRIRSKYDYLSTVT